MTKRSFSKISSNKESDENVMENEKKKSFRSTKHLHESKRKISFTKHQDELLVQAVMTFNDMNPCTYRRHVCFRSVVTLIAGRLNIKRREVPFTPKQLKTRWEFLISNCDNLPPDNDTSRSEICVNFNDWKEDQTKSLLSEVEKQQKSKKKLNWQLIAENVSSKFNDFECYLRYCQLCNTRQHAKTGEKIRKKRWSSEEDQRLVKAIGQCGGGVGQAGFSWRAVVNLMNGRSLRQCQRRWHDHLKFPVRGEVHSSTDWTVNEIHFLLELVRWPKNLCPSGRIKWQRVSSYFCGMRSAGQCRIKFCLCAKCGINLLFFFMIDFPLGAKNA